MVSTIPNAMILYNPAVDTGDCANRVKNASQDRKAEISPCHHVRKGIPPTLIFHGTAASIVPFEHVERFTRLMKEAGNKCILVPFDNKEHGFFNGSVFRPGNGDGDFKITMDKGIEFLIELGYLQI